MHDKFTTMTPALYEYLVAHNPAPDPVLRDLAAETAALGRISIMQIAVAPIPTMHPSGEIWANLGHPAAPDRLALAVGSPGSTFADYGIRWDNSGKNGHYAPINWSN